MWSCWQLEGSVHPCPAVPSFPLPDLAQLLLAAPMLPATAPLTLLPPSLSLAARCLQSLPCCPIRMCPSPSAPEGAPGCPSSRLVCRAWTFCEFPDGIVSGKLARLFRRRRRGDHPGFRLRTGADVSRAMPGSYSPPSRALQPLPRPRGTGPALARV